jgi:hypothetical protein
MIIPRRAQVPKMRHGGVGARVRSDGQVLWRTAAGRLIIAAPTVKHLLQYGKQLADTGGGRAHAGTKLVRNGHCAARIGAISSRELFPVAVRLFVATLRERHKGRYGPFDVDAGGVRECDHENQ